MNKNYENDYVNQDIKQQMQEGAPLLMTHPLYILLKFRMWFKYGLKAQKLLAQGIALGIMAISKAPCKGKSFVYC